MITSIAISNYKSISDLPSLPLGQINFLIGKNGVGKSNLISAIELTRRLCNGDNFEQATRQIAPFGIEIFTRGSSMPNASINLGVKDGEGKRYELVYTFGLSNNEFLITNEKLFILQDNNKVEVYVRDSSSFKARVSLEQPLVDVPFTAKPGELAIASFNNEISTKVAKTISNFKVLWFDKTSDPYSWHIHKQDSLDVSNLDGLVISLYENNRPAFDKAVAVIQQIIPEFVAPRVDRLPAPTSKSGKDGEESKALDRYVVFWGEKEVQEIQYTLSGLSDGNFRVIQLVLALFDSETSSCVIGEEIENGQHYGRIKTLMEVLKHLAIKLNIQLLFSTHSGELLGHISPTDVIFCAKDQEGHSAYKKLSDAVNTDMVKVELGREPTARELIDLGMV